MEEFTTLEIGRAYQSHMDFMNMQMQQMMSLVGVPSSNVVRIQARGYGRSFHAAGRAIDIANQNMRVVPIPEGQTEQQREASRIAFREALQDYIASSEAETIRSYPTLELDNLQVSNSNSDLAIAMGWTNMVMKGFGKKPEWPLVSDCCGTPNWVSAFREDNSGANDICLHCNKITKVVLMTVEHYNNMSENEHMSAEQFETLWTKRPIQNQE